MADPTDMISAMLGDMRDGAPSMSRESAERLTQIVSRVDRIEAAQVSLTRALSVEARISKVPPGAFRDRLEARARWIAGQETHA